MPRARFGDYREYAPSAPLRGSVVCFWSRGAGGGHRVLPDGCIDILFARADAGAGFSGAVVGTMTTAIVTGDAPSDFVGARFAPGEAARYLAFSASDVTDRAFALGDVWGPIARDVASALDDACDAAACVRALDAALVRRLAACAPGDFRLRRAVRALAAGALSVSAVAAEVGLSTRQLGRLFDERVGVGPKMLGRVYRLQRALHAQRATGSAWTAAASHAGYADQAHLVRDFRQLAGVTPGGLSRGDAEAVSLG